jgi:signal transduction histidine kinase
MLGRRVEEVLGEEAFRVIGPRIEEALAGKAVSYEAELAFPNAGRRYVHVDYVPHAEGGRVRGFFALVHDATARRQAELDRLELARTQAAIRARDEMIAVVSHDLRAPLQSLLLWVEVLRRRPDNIAAVRDGAEAIGRSVRLQKLLIDDLLDHARIVTGKLFLHFRPVRLGECVRAAADAVRPEAEARSLELCLPPEGSLPVIEADPDRLQQVFWNLLSNAVKFTPPGGRVELRAERDGRDGGTVRLAVADTGRGIRPDLLPRLFERFRQEDPRLSGGFLGLGLGLSITKGIVEAHRGRIWAESDGEGKGSVFRIELPLRQDVPYVPNVS